MQRKVWGRFFIVLGVVLIAFYYVYPSIRLIHYKTTVKPPRDITSPQYKEYHQRLREIENRTLPFGAAPIRFGLDLEGGTDIMLALDQEATVRDRLNELRRAIRREMQRERIGATIAIDVPQRAIVIALSRPEDARIANTILDPYKDRFQPWDQGAFERGERVVLKLRDREITRYQNEAIESALKVIRRRVDVLGLVQPVVVKQGNTRIRVQMPGVEDPQAVIDTIIKPAQLEFRFLHKKSDEEVRKLFTPEDYKKVCDYIAKRKSLPDPLPLKPDAEIPPGYTLVPGEWIDHSGEEQGKPPVRRYKPFLVRDTVEITGARLRNAWVYFNAQNLVSPWEISLEFNRQGTYEFREITRQHVGDQLAIILDGFLYSAPVIKTVIPNGRARIEGDFTQKEAVDLSLVLKAGALPANLRPIQSSVVEATLGTDSIRKGINALLIGAVAVVIFMISYYGTSGFIAVIALAINVLCIAAILSLSRATLTLSGIGGILLTIGMAVDANVLIYERIREEKATSRGLKAAITKGFGRAFSVIFDSNLTTLITALVLLQFGVGSVQGFALTMTFGIFATLFTGLFVTHVLTDLWVQWRNGLSVGKLRIFRNPKFNVMGMRHFGYAISFLLLATGIGTMIAKGGPQFGVQFTGGVVADVGFEKPTSEDEIKNALAGTFPTPIVQKIRGEQNRFILRVKTVGGDLQKTAALLRQALTKHYGEKVVDIGSTEAISSEVGGEFVKKAIVAILIASVGILIYLWFRFELIFGAGAVTALFHDVLVTLGLVTIFGQEISLDVVAALLIVVGYSVNDTIVIFDRIRETIRTTYGVPYPEMLNKSINESLNRTFVTSLSTLFTTLVMLFFGGPGLRGFALVLTIGIIIGTYSSSFVATPVIYEYQELRRRRQEKTD